MSIYTLLFPFFAFLWPFPILSLCLLRKSTSIHLPRSEQNSSPLSSRSWWSSSSPISSMSQDMGSTPSSITISRYSLSSPISDSTPSPYERSQRNMTKKCEKKSPETSSHSGLYQDWSSLYLLSLLRISSHDTILESHSTVSWSSEYLLSSDSSIARSWVISRLYSKQNSLSSPQHSGNSSPSRLWHMRHLSRCFGFLIVSDSHGYSSPESQETSSWRLSPGGMRVGIRVYGLPGILTISVTSYASHFPTDLPSSSMSYFSKSTRSSSLSWLRRQMLTQSSLSTHCRWSSSKSAWCMGRYSSIPSSLYWLSLSRNPITWKQKNSSDTQRCSCFPEDSSHHSYSHSVHSRSLASSRVRHSSILSTWGWALWMHSVS